MADLTEVPLLISNQWQSARASRWDEVFNPSTGEAIARVPLCAVDDADRAVRAADDALPGWSRTPVVERARLMFRFRELLVKHAADLAALVTREHGKTRAESRASVQRGIEMVEFACGIPSLLMGQSLEQIAPNVDCETVRHPVGVCVGITPFNFPVMVPLWMFPVALTCGNTFVLKPSQKVPLSAVRLGELLVEAGVPAGVFNIVHGDDECGDALVRHPLVQAVSFVGSTPIARRIYEAGTQHGKRVQAAGGAKNHLVVMPDADLEQAVAAVATSAFGCAGERCMAGSVVAAVGSSGPEVVERLCEVARTLRVGPTDGDQDVDMGPLISTQHRRRITGYLEMAEQEGATIALDGRARNFSGGGFLLGPSILDHVRPEMQVAREEIFGPLLSVSRVADLDEALELGRRCEYGNGASLFTRSGWAASQFKRHFNAGMIGINVGVPAPMAWFPFAGWNQSFFGDLHMQGSEGIQFYTRQKLTMTRWFGSPHESAQDPIWRK